MPKFQGVYRDAKGGWYFKVQGSSDPLTGRRVQVTRRGFTTASAAAQARQRFLQEVEDGTAPIGGDRSMTVNELIDQWLDFEAAAGRLSAKTLFDYRRSVDDYVRPHLGERRVAEVVPAMIVAWQSRLLERGGVKTGSPLAPNTVRLARAPLSAAFKYGIVNGLVRSNPLTGVPRPTPRRKIPKHWSPEQARAFLASQRGDRHWPMWVFLLSSGMRVGELVALRWENVDLRRGRIRVCEFSSTLDYGVAASNGKSKDAVRTIDIDDQLVGVLTDHRTAQLEEAALFGAAPPEHVFTTRFCQPYHPQSVSTLLAKLSQEAGLPRLTAHGLRHSCATLLLAAGVPPKVAAERLGHADTTLFLNLYSHVTPTMQREAAALLGNALLGPEE